MKPLVSVGIPTYKRPDLLDRALKSVFFQDYDRLEIIVSDNNFNNAETLEVLTKYSNSAHKIAYYNQKMNLGSVKNLFFLLDVAKGQYFMWLADDDEIEGSSYISELVSVLNKDDSAVTAYARWKLMESPFSSVYISGRDYNSDSWILRSINYFWFPNDDFFYGLHRVSSLREARMLHYSWPNKMYISNWAYIYLFDQVLRGKIIQTKNKTIAWVNHEYTVKNYTLLGGGKIKFILKHILRRINVYYLYLQKIHGYKGLVSCLLFIPVVVLSLFAELLAFLLNRCFKFFDFIVSKVRQV